MVAIKGIWVLGKGWEESALLFNSLLLYLERNLETSFLISGILNSSVFLSCYVKKRSLSTSLWDDCFAGRVSLYNYEIRNKLGISEPLNSWCFAWSISLWGLADTGYLSSQILGWPYHLLFSQTLCWEWKGYCYLQDKNRYKTILGTHPNAHFLKWRNMKPSV